MSLSSLLGLGLLTLLLLSGLGLLSGLPLLSGLARWWGLISARSWLRATDRSAATPRPPLHISLLSPRLRLPQPHSALKWSLSSFPGSSLSLRSTFRNKKTLRDVALDVAGAALKSPQWTVCGRAVD